MGNLSITLNCVHPAKHDRLPGFLCGEINHGIQLIWREHEGNCQHTECRPSLSSRLVPSNFRKSLLINFSLLHALYLITVLVEMPSATPEIPPYSYVPETKEHLDWADCKFQTPSKTPTA